MSKGLFVRRSTASPQGPQELGPARPGRARSDELEGAADQRPGPVAQTTQLGRRSKRNAIVVPAAGLVCLFAISWIVPIATREKPNALVSRSLLVPSWGYPFGTDELGRDLFARVLGGMRISCEIALITIVVAGVTGTAIGLYSGYHAGWRDSLMMRVADFFLGFPVLVFALLLAAVIGPATTTPAVATTVISVPLFRGWFVPPHLLSETRSMSLHPGLSGRVARALCSGHCCRL